MSENNNPRKKVRYGVVGLGHIAQVAILPAFKSARNSQLVTIVSGDAEKLDQLGKKYGLAELYSYEDYDKALATIDAVYIAVPNHLHKEYAVRAARAGVHVLCEKPMAVTEEECRAMMQAADEGGVKLMIAYRLHFERGNLEAIHLANSGRLGNVRAFTSEFGQQVVPENIRLTKSVEEGGGPVYDMGVYCINAARYLFQDDPTEVLATAATRNDPEFSKAGEMVSVVMRFPQERLATFTCSFGSVDVSRYTVIGTEGVLTAEPAYDYTLAIKHHLTIGDKTVSKTFPKRDQFAAELVYFSDCIRKDKQPEPSGLEGLEDIRIVQAIYESVRSGRKVEIAPLPDKPRPALSQEIHVRPHGKPEEVHAESPSGEAA